MINMQYKLTILDETAGQTSTTLTNARLFEDVPVVNRMWTIRWVTLLLEQTIGRK